MSVLDDLVSTPLQAFSPETLSQLQTDGKCESLYFELKETWKPDDVTRCVAAFANRDGGFLFFGVRQTADGCIASFPGLDAGPEYPTLAKDRIVGHISPLPTWDAIAVSSPDDANRVVLVMRVERSNVTPHVATQTGRIYVRTPAACDPVLDRPSIDVLTVRGQAGATRLEARWGELIETPWDEPTPEYPSFEIIVGAIPTSTAGETSYPTC
jgi:hypothetical protein